MRKVIYFILSFTFCISCIWRKGNKLNNGELFINVYDSKDSTFLPLAEINILRSSRLSIDTHTSYFANNFIFVKGQSDKNTCFLFSYPEALPQLLTLKELEKSTGNVYLEDISLVYWDHNSIYSDSIQSIIDSIFYIRMKHNQGVLKEK